MPDAPYKHSDIRRNPDLEEWFCANCGATSDHTLQADAIMELSNFECSLMGATAKAQNEKERDLRTHYRAKLKRTAEKNSKKE